MLAKAILFTFASNTLAAPWVVTNPEDKHSTWYSHNYNATRETMTSDSTRWTLTVQGRNGVPNPGLFAALCTGLQNRLPVSKAPPAFVPCNDTAYEARQYIVGTGTTVEVRRTTHPDFEKEVRISATANYSSTGDVVMGNLSFAEFKTEFILTTNEA